MICDRYLVEEIAKVALSIQSIIFKCKIWIDVGLAPLAPEWSLLTIVNVWQFTLCLTVLILILRCLSEWLHDEPEGNLGLLGEYRFLRRLNNCTSHVLGPAVSLIYLDPRDTC